MVLARASQLPVHESAREVCLARHFSVARGTTSVAVMRGVSFTFSEWEAHLENEPRGISF